jgi:hypothetical protein
MKSLSAIRPLVVIAFSVGVASPQQDPVPQAHTRVYDVRDITRVERDFRPATVVDASFVPSADEVSESSGPALEPADLAEMIRIGTSPMYWEQEGVELRVEDGGLLTLTCDEAMHAKARSVLAKLRRLMFEPVRIELHELPGSALAGRGSVLSSEEADSLLFEAGEHRVLAGRANPRKPLLLEAKRTRNRISGLHMRVAQDAAAPDLALATDSYGPSWTVWAMRTVDDAMLVTVSGCDRSLETDGPACELPTGEGAEVVAVKLPVTRIATCHTSAYLLPGQALLVGTDAPAGAVLCVRLHRTGQGTARELGDVTAYPVSGLVRGATPTSDLRVPYEDGLLFPAPDGEPMPAVFDEGRLMEWLMTQVDPETWGGAPNSMNFAHGHLFVRAEAATQKAIAEQLQSLQGLDTRQFTVEVCFGEVPADVLKALKTENAEQLAAALPHHCLSTVSASRETRISATRHTPYVKDYDVVIATGSAATTPQLGSIAQGFLLRGSVAPMDQGTVLLDLHMTILAHGRERSVFALQHPRFAHVDEIDVHENKVRGATVVELGQWAILHLAPIVGGQSHVAVVARVRST